MFNALSASATCSDEVQAYIIYRIALCIHLEVYLALSMLILNETIRVDLVWLLKIRVISNL